MPVIDQAYLSTFSHNPFCSPVTEVSLVSLNPSHFTDEGNEAQELRVSFDQYLTIKVMTLRLELSVTPEPRLPYTKLLI